MDGFVSFLLYLCIFHIQVTVGDSDGKHVCVCTCNHLYSSVFLLSLCFGPSPASLSGEMRVQLLNQTLLDLGLYDDGPYEVADQKQLNAKLIPVPYHSYLGRICPRCSLLPVQERKRGPRRDDATGLQSAPPQKKRTRTGHKS